MQIVQLKTTETSPATLPITALPIGVVAVVTSSSIYPGWVNDLVVRANNADNIVNLSKKTWTNTGAGSTSVRHLLPSESVTITRS